MSRARGPKRHYHLSSDSIARAALAIIDREGIEALNLRDLAASLGVGTMTLYGHVSGRDEIVRNVVGLLLAEIDTGEKAGETWGDTIWRIAHSVYEVALRHPQAYELVALAPETEPPVLDHARKIERLHAAQHIPEELFIKMWSVVDAFVTGFLLLKIKGAVREPRLGELADPEAASLAAHLPEAETAAAFDEGLEIVIAGFRSAFMTEEGHQGPGE